LHAKWKEWIRASVCCNRTINLHVLVLHTRPWSLHQKHRHHMLDINFLDSLQDVRRSKIPSHDNVSTTWKTLFLCIFIYFFLCLILKSRNLYDRNKLLVKIMKNKILILTKYNILNSILPNCIVILPNSLGNTVISLIPIKNFLGCQFCKIISSLN
jgi:hypothetical protein